MLEGRRLPIPSVSRFRRQCTRKMIVTGYCWIVSVEMTSRKHRKGATVDSLELVSRRVPRVITNPLTHQSLSLLPSLPRSRSSRRESARARAFSLNGRIKFAVLSNGPRKFEKSQEPFERDLESRSNELEVLRKLRDNCRRRRRSRVCIVARVDAMTSPTQRAALVSRPNFGEAACAERSASPTIRLPFYPPPSLPRDLSRFLVSVTSYLASFFSGTRRKPFVSLIRSNINGSR